MIYGAAKKTRTSTGFTPQRPQRCASTNSAMAARMVYRRYRLGAMYQIMITITREKLKINVTRLSSNCLFFRHGLVQTAQMTTSARLDRDSLKTGMLPTGDNSPVIWEISDTPVAYDDAVERMERIAGEIRRGEATETRLAGGTPLPSIPPAPAPSPRICCAPSSPSSNRPWWRIYLSWTGTAGLLCHAGS